MVRLINYLLCLSLCYGDCFYFFFCVSVPLSCHKVISYYISKGVIARLERVLNKENIVIEPIRAQGVQFKDPMALFVP